MLQRLRKQSRPTSWFINDGFFCFMTIQITGRLVVAMNIVDIIPSQVRSGSDRGSGTINVNIGINLIWMVSINLNLKQTLTNTQANWVKECYLFHPTLLLSWRTKKTKEGGIWDGGDENRNFKLVNIKAVFNYAWNQLERALAHGSQKRVPTVHFLYKEGSETNGMEIYN